MNDWVKHAEAKLAVVLTAAGVSGGVLFNLVKNRSDTSCIFNVAAVVCCAAIIIAAICAMTGLYPIVRVGQKRAEDGVNPLFFHDVARAYRDNAPSYASVLHTLTTSPDDLVRHISHQIHSNATVAQRKYRWVNHAVRALVLDLLTLGALSTIIAMGW
ncbi:hypothetical protein GTV32_16305 [Gordonia sp. SID5947]|uniref:Pycsar system effector family protein n=1 Tax=Gordonia sp. SID5947 TaxID=2690315 RepID=UPI00136A9924|nr:hypothetical protein [Gordonia sp. SID5947]